MQSAAYEFTSDWFSKNRPVWDELLSRWRPSRIIEIGSYEGRCTCYLIETCAAERSIELHCVDTWEGGIEHDSVEMAAVEARFEHNVRLATQRIKNGVKLRKHKEPSNYALGKLLTTEDPCSFDLIYVDGSHQAPDVLTDAVLGFQLLRPGGLMIFDDYLWHMEPHGRQDPLNMPKPAIDAFVNTFQRKLRVLIGPPIYQLYVEKIAD